MENSVKNCSNMTEDTLYIEIGSSKYIEFIKNLILIAKKTNSPSICCECWCFLTNSQLISHRKDHHKNRKTPSHYATEANFRALAEEKHVWIIGSIQEIKVLFAKPLASNQEKIKSKALKSNMEGSKVSVQESKVVIEESKVAEKESKTTMQTSKELTLDKATTEDEDESILLAEFLKKHREKIRNSAQIKLIKLKILSNQ